MFISHHTAQCACFTWLPISGKHCPKQLFLKTNESPLAAFSVQALLCLTNVCFPKQLFLKNSKISLSAFSVQAFSFQTNICFSQVRAMSRQSSLRTSKRRMFLANSYSLSPSTHLCDSLTCSSSFLPLQVEHCSHLSVQLLAFFVQCRPR